MAQVFLAANGPVNGGFMMVEVSQTGVNPPFGSIEGCDSTPEKSSEENS